MHVAIVTIKGISPYSQSLFLAPSLFPKNPKETHDDYEKRAWIHRVHVNDSGKPFMPPMALKKALDGAASYLGKIPGQRNATYSKRVKSGILITDEIQLLVGDPPRQATMDDVQSDWLHLDAGGKAGQGSTRVLRRMPKFVGWSAVARVYIGDDLINQDVLRQLIQNAGCFVGVGRFRPANGGFHGRFDLMDLKWE